MVRCEKCGSERKVRYYVAHEGVKSGNICRKCVQPSILNQSAKVYIRKYGSFLDYCNKEVCNNFLDEYWSDKNTVDPNELPKTSQTKVWIRCKNKDYHDDYHVSCAKFVRGDRCPQCRSGIHRLDSLGSAINALCGEGYAELRWSNMNEIQAYEIPPTSHYNIWLKCPLGIHDDYMQSATNARRSEYDCPMCARERHNSRLQEKVEYYIKDNYAFLMNFEWNCTLTCENESTGRKMPYDIEVVPLNLIIEVNGQQHYLESSFHLKTNETKKEKLRQQKERDTIKKEHAINSGYHFLEIPYWTEKDNSYEHLIDNAITKALNQTNISF